MHATPSSHPFRQLWLLGALACAACGGVVQSNDANADQALRGIANCANGKILRVTANGAQDGNPASNAIDGDLSTRWSNEGAGAWLTADLGSVQPLCGAAIAWYLGKERTSAFTLSTSTDGKTFRQVAAGTSSGKTNQLQPTAFTSVQARYVRFTVVNGNSQNDWASITEVAVGVGSASTLDAGSPKPPVDAGTPPRDAGTPPKPDAGTPSYDFPDATNTGVPAGVTLKAYSGPYKITTDNTVIEGVKFNQTVEIAAKNVTIKSSYFDPGGDYFCVEMEDDASATIQDSELLNANAAAIAGDNLTLLRLNIHDMIGDGAKVGSNWTLQDSYIHDFVPCGDCHSDGAQMQDGTTNVTIRHNHLAGLNKQTGTYDGVNSALFLQPDLGDTNGAGPVYVDNNLFEGGGWTLYIDPGHGGLIEHGYHVTNNRWTRTGQYGPVSVEDTADIAEWTNNAFIDGTPIDYR